MSNIKKILRAVRRESGYDRFHEWEPATDYAKDNSNYPFKPQTMETLPQREEFGIRAEAWDGGLSDWDHALQAGRVGHVFDFYITKVGDELVTNIKVWVKSETEAVWSDCGGPEHTLKVFPADSRRRRFPKGRKIT